MHTKERTGPFHFNLLIGKFSCRCSTCDEERGIAEGFFVEVRNGEDLFLLGSENEVTCGRCSLMLPAFLVYDDPIEAEHAAIEVENNLAASLGADWLALIPLKRMRFENPSYALPLGLLQSITLPLSFASFS